MNTRKFSYNQEKRIAKNLGGKVVSNSGATPFAKGDVSLEHILIDGKTLTKKQASVSLKKEWFEKIKSEAFSMNKDAGVVCFDFGDKDLYYAVDARMFKKLIDAYEEVLNL